MQYLDFEEPLVALDAKITEAAKKKDSKLKELTALRDKKLSQIYSNLTPWQRTLVARHENRPHTLEYIDALTHDFCKLCGDRTFADDEAVIGGFAKFDGQTVMIIGTEKGHDIQTRLTHNFGMAKPEGYRKAIRLMKLAEQFNVPVITLVDTAGAFPGVEGEERGQGQAIASCIEAGLDLTVPFVSVIIGEGGSGGAIALATANKILMLENAIYSVISPEGCASILWKDHKYASKAAEILHLTANDLFKFGVIDQIVDEPKGGAHRFPKETILAVKKAITEALSELKKYSAVELVQLRHDKFLKMTRLGGK